MAARSRRPEIQHRFTPGTALSSQAQRRRIHNAKNNRAKFLAARHRQMVRNSAITIALIALARFG